MKKNTYTLLNKFECCVKTMVTVIIEKKAACVMEKREFNRMIETEQKFEKWNRTKTA